MRTVKDTDDRITCAQCANGCRPGPCKAAGTWELTSSRNYDPDRKTLRRCEAFRPLPDNPDKRRGRQRWPYLTFQPEKSKK